MEERNIPEITPTELLEMLEALDRMPNPPALMIYGPPGVGKTTILNEFVKRKGYESRVKHLSRMDTTDWSGIPREGAGYTEFLPISLFKPPINAGKKIVIFFDELNTAQSGVLNAALDVILEKKGDSDTLGNLAKLPDNTIILAAGNLGPEEDGTDTAELSMAVKTRLVQLRLFPDLTQWLNWAKAAKINPKVISFIEKKGMKYLLDLAEFRDNNEQAATPRGWERISKFLEKAEEIAKEGKDIYSLVSNFVYGAIGRLKGEAFIAYYMKPAEAMRAWKQKITPKLAILNMQEITAELKDLPELLTLVNEGMEYNFPEAYEIGIKVVEKIFVENAKKSSGVFTAISGIEMHAFREFLKDKYPVVYKKFKGAEG